MIRLTLLWFFVAFLCGYAFRNWFVALCGLVLLTLLSQHPDMPHGVFNISGLSPWNLVFISVVTACMMARTKQAPPLPRVFAIFFAAYVFLLLVGAARALLDFQLLASRSWKCRSVSYIVFELVLNPLKYLMVGVLFYRGCRTTKQVWLGTHTILLFGLLHALLMFKTMKGMVLFGNYEDARRMTDKMIGLHANDLAGLLTFSFWALVVYASVLKGRARVLACVAALVILPAIVGCHSRAAYLANIGIAVVLGAVRWRKLLMMFPVGVLATLLVFPQILERLSMDVGVEDVSGSRSSDWNDVTAGRTYNIWEPTLTQIAHAPLFGHGRYALWRTPSFHVIKEREGQVPSHPHNSYLEILVDSGLVGLTIVFGLFGSVGLMAVRMARTRASALVVLVGGMGVAAVVCVGMLGLSSNFVYPKESLLWVVCSIALTARTWTACRAERRDPVRMGAHAGTLVQASARSSPLVRWGQRRGPSL